MYRKGVTTGVNIHIRKLVEKNTRFDTELSQWHREIVFDPQTSGGLMVALPENQGEDLIDALKNAGESGSRIIGRVTDRQDNIHLVFT